MAARQWLAVYLVNFCNVVPVRTISPHFKISNSVLNNIIFLIYEKKRSFHMHFELTIKSARFSKNWEKLDAIRRSRLLTGYISEGLSGVRGGRIPRAQILVPPPKTVS